MRSEASMGIYMVRGVGWVNRSVQSLSLIQTLHSQLPLVGGWLLSSLTDYSLVSAKLAVPSLPTEATAAMVAILNIFFIFH